MRAHKGFFKLKNSKKGLSLSTVMVICIVLTILVAMLVSMASLNINTTQSAVNQREAYIQAKSALAFAESYYYNHGDAIPGGGSTGEGLVVFNTDNIADGAVFYEIKSGLSVLLDDATVQRYKDECPDTYIEVTKARSSSGSNMLTLNAVSKYGNNQAYTLSREFTIGGYSASKDNSFTGEIKYKTTSGTRYVRFHVRATSALGGAPYFYMWYNKVSPDEYKDAAKTIKNPEFNPYATSSIVNKLTFNHAYGKVQNGSWGNDGPEGACAMAYEGNGWYYTQKTFNMSRNVNFVNGIVTRTGGHRSKEGGGYYDDQQSWEFFGIPIPTKTEGLGEENGVDVYFELNQGRLKDMVNVKVGNTWKDEFSQKYESFAEGRTGKEQLNEFVKYCGQWYSVYTKKDSYIVHYREANVTDDSHGYGDFTYEGYGWWRDCSQNGDDNILGFTYNSGRIISRHQRFDKEIIREMFVCTAGDEKACFQTEEEANEWFIQHGDVAAGDYVEVNVKASAQPVDAEIPTTITYSADLYEKTNKVPTPPNTDLDVEPTANKVEEPEVTDLDGKNEELEIKKLGNPTYGSYFLVGSMNNWQNWQNGGTWLTMTDQLSHNDGTSEYFIDYNVTAGEPIEFWVVQRPESVYYVDAYSQYNRRTRSWERVLGNNYQSYMTVDESLNVWDSLRGDDNHAVCYYDEATRKYYEFESGYCNYWGNDANRENAHPYCYSMIPDSDWIRIVYDAQAGAITRVESFGTKVNTNVSYNVVGWMNDWGEVKDDDGNIQYLYDNKNPIELYRDVENKMSFTDRTLIISSGKEYRFKVVERDLNNPSATIDWSAAYGADAQISNEVGYVATDDTSVVIFENPDDGQAHRYIVTISYDPVTHIPSYETTELYDEENFYVVGEFNGWEESIAPDFNFKNMTAFELEADSADENDINYSYRLKSLQEVGDYKIRVVSSLAEIKAATDTDTEIENVGKVDYRYSWGQKLDAEEGDENYLVTESADAKPAEYSLTERSYVTINFKYHKNDPTRSEITTTVVPLSSTDFDVEDVDSDDLDENGRPKMIYVGFHNDKLEDVNNDNKPTQFTKKWDKVYVTYYTEATGYNCNEMEKDPDSENWWYQIPSYAKHIFFSNWKSNIYKNVHSEEYEYTVDIQQSAYKGTKSSIFFPISYEEDDESRKCWTNGDAMKYNSYINKQTHITNKTEDMAWYGSIQCNYYNAPIVNILNMLVCGDPRPMKGYVFCPAPRTRKSGSGYNYKFYGCPTVTYQGETYYYQEIGSGYSRMVVENWYNTSTRDNWYNIIGNGGNSNYCTMTAELWEQGFSLEPGNVSFSWSPYSSYSSDKTYEKDGNIYYANINSYDRDLTGYFLMEDRAGGVFVSDKTYRDNSPSVFNYNGYTPNWYTFRIPVTDEVAVNEIKGVTGINDVVVSNPGTETNPAKTFKVAKTDANVNRAVYYYKDAVGKVNMYTYNRDMGITDLDPEIKTYSDGSRHNTGKNWVNVYFDTNGEDWKNPCVYAYNLMGDQTYTINNGVINETITLEHECYAKVTSVTDDVYHKFTVDPETNDNNYYRFRFLEGDYCFFVFFDAGEGNEPNAATLEAAAHKSSTLYFTGLELNKTTDQYLSEYANLNGRTTQTLCLGSASRLEWYMHPKTAVMNNYLAIDGVAQMMSNTKYYSYDKTQGTYGCHGDVGMSEISGKRDTFKDYYEGGNMSDGTWSVLNLSDDEEALQGVLEAGQLFNDAVSEARIYISDDIRGADTDNWYGTDIDQCMVFMEGEQLVNSAFKYTDNWTNGLKNTYKSFMLDKLNVKTSDGKTVTQDNSNNCIYTEGSMQTAQTLIDCTAKLRNWLDNPQYTLRDDAVRIIVDDTGKYEDEATSKPVYKNPWGKDQITLYVKDNGKWIPYAKADKCDTTQANFYAFVFLFPEEFETVNEGVISKYKNEYWGHEFCVSYTAPNKDGYVDGIPVKSLTIYPGTTYRVNTAYFGIDAEKFFSVDNTTEVKHYNGTDITEGVNSPTNGLNEWVSMNKDHKFVLNFKYDTWVTGGGKRYKIYAGTYTIDQKYPGFYKDFGGSNADEVDFTGINLYTDDAEAFFTNPVNIGMTNTIEYSNWSSNRSGSKTQDIMTQNITTKGGSATAESTEGNVNFRYNGEKDHDTLNMERKIQLTGTQVSMACNNINFRGYSNDFVIDSKQIVFKTDTTIIKTDGSKVVIDHGIYVFDETDESNRYTKVSLKSTQANGDDWRKRYVLVSETGTKMEGGKYVTQ